MLALAIASLVLAIVKGQEWGWTSARIIGAFALTLALGVYFVLRTSRQRTPVVDLTLLRIRSFALSNGVTVVMASGFFGYTLCNVLFLTTVWQYSILKAGLSLTPGPLVAIAVAAPASHAVSRFGHRAVAVPGALIWAAGAAFYATQLGVHPDFLGQWLPGMVILGIGAGLSFPTLSGAAVESVPGPRFALATSLNAVARQVGRRPGGGGPDRDRRQRIGAVHSSRPAGTARCGDRERGAHQSPGHVRQRLAVRVRMLPVRRHRLPGTRRRKARRGGRGPDRDALGRPGRRGTGRPGAGGRAPEPG